MTNRFCVMRHCQHTPILLLVLSLQSCFFSVSAYSPKNLVAIRPFQCLDVSRRNSISSTLTTTTSSSLPSRPSSLSKLAMAKMFSSSSANSQKTTTTQFITNKLCPYAHKAWIALEISQCPYVMKEVSLYGPGGKPDWFWDLNPRGTVPIVVVISSEDQNGKKVFADSELILDAFANGSVGGATRESNRLLLAKEEDGTFHYSEETLQNISRWRDAISNRLAPIGKKAVLGGSHSQLRSLLEELNDMVEGPYLAGEKFSVADCAAFPFFWRIDQEFGIGNGKYGKDEEKLREWLDRCLDIEGVKNTIPRGGWWWWW